MGRLIRDEAGIALGLAVIMVVLIGVMGAGLLVFVRTNLEAVVEVNQGQRAFDIADAGVQDAKRHLLMQDATRQHYDLTHLNDCVAGQRLSEEDWSPATTVYVNADCTGGTITRSTPGVTKEFAGGKFTVTIRCYVQDPVVDCAGVTEAAPELVSASARAFFKIISVGHYGQAKRKIEAIYFASRSLDVPTGYFADKGNINFNGNFPVRGVSFFSGRNIIISNQQLLNLDRATPALYEDWRLAPYNTERREEATRSIPQVGVGLGAAGLICNSANQCTSSANSVANGIHDYDSSTGPDSRNVGSRKKFIRKSSATAPQTSNEITFPFDPNKAFPIDLLREEASRQGNYYAASGSSFNIDNNNYPRNSTDRTIFFVDANGASVDYRVNTGATNPQARGVIVINNGNLTTSSSSNGLNGFAIITGNGSLTGNYTSSGSATINGFVVSSGSQTISGSVNPSPSRLFTNTPGFYGVRLWSWRELYE